MTFEDFLNLVSGTPGIRAPNPEQGACLRSDPATPTMIVAGPGSGKTTVLVLRALRHILVDGVAPEQIVITTFTIKAAREVRSRLIEWGELLLEAARALDLPEAERAFLQHADINRVITGTLDSICQEALGSDRHADEPPLVTLEAFAARVLLQRRGGLVAAFNANRAVLGDYLATFTMDGDPPETVAEAASAIIPVIERLVQDRVDIERFGAAGEPLAHRIVAQIAADYRTYLRDNNLLDFSGLEEALLQRLRDGRIPTLLAGVKVVLVDEYQDTNALQEAIYFELVMATQASFSVVGDDDQSLYRFRGATIELFRAFIDRCRARLGRAPAGPLYLVQNYRSTGQIVDHFNAFVRNDPNFGPARIQPPKPVIEANAQDDGYPVMAMFRSDRGELADAVAGFLHGVFRGGGFIDADGRLPSPLRGREQGGDLGDAVFLGSRVLEVQRPYFGQAPTPQFTSFLREALAARDLHMFNPRGRSLRDIPEVEQLLGLVLLAVDRPNATGGAFFEDLPITLVAKFYLRRWMDMGRAFLATQPGDIYGKNLANEMAQWQAFVRGGRSERNSGRDWPFLDVIYSLAPWIRFFEVDPEGQVYLEAISRAAGQAAGFSSYRGRIIRPNAGDPQDHARRSLAAIVHDVIAPIAENVIDVDEEVMPSVPRDRLNVMTIHQAKGLEYPLVIVDVGADFTRDHPKNRFRRYPDEPSSTAMIEDALAPFTPELGALRMARGPLDRSFEDLVRLYYVAFSRPQTALLLIGCDKMLGYKTKIRHVATSWRQDGGWTWKDQTPPTGGRKAPAIVAPRDILFL